mmetsp:Transcript_5171/g.11402  ORF Transcript_5171/g.11402 Transcript_5171/m.11402 type:complete len:111 (-) Transcript_5171:122-454(-)
MRSATRPIGICLESKLIARRFGFVLGPLQDQGGPCRGGSPQDESQTTRKLEALQVDLTDLPGADQLVRIRRQTPFGVSAAPKAKQLSKNSRSDCICGFGDDNEDDRPWYF